MSPRHSAARANRGRLLAVFGLTIAILVIEVTGGLLANSLALLADAGHVFTDVAGVGLALGAIWIADRPASGGRTFGYLRLEILAAVVNAVLLFGVAAFVLVEAWRRLAEPPEVSSGLMLVVALIGLAGNSVSLYVLRHAQRESLNMRGAYLEVLGDLAGSVAVIVAAVAIALIGWTPADAVASAVGDVHDLHAWTITSGMNVVSAHVVLDMSADPPAVLDELCRCLSGDFDIEHSTFQLETLDRRRLEEARHA